MEENGREDGGEGGGEEVVMEVATEKDTSIGFPFLPRLLSPSSEKRKSRGLARGTATSRNEAEAGHDHDVTGCKLEKELQKAPSPEFTS